MPHYIAPTKDMQFVLNDVLDVKNSSIPGYSDLDSDFLSAILEEAGKITSQVLAPINASGDQQGCQFENGVVGDVMGKFHPHGDAAIYDAMVRLAQDFAMRYQLVDGQGNFGNVDGDNAAAMRYTEARMTEVARLLLDGIDEDASRSAGRGR